MRDDLRPGSGLGRCVNTTGTIAEGAGVVTSQATPGAEGTRSGRRCGFVAAESWSYDNRSPFCDAPAAPGSSYCPQHRALCVVLPHSAEGAAVSSALTAAAETAPPPPPELGFLDPLALPEADAEPEPRDLRDLVDLPAPDVNGGDR
jgi:hypothetical protein